MQRILLISLVLYSSVAAADLADEVRCREIGFSKSIENEDIEAFKSFVDADARFISNRPRRGIDEIAEGWSTFIGEGSPSIRWRPIYVEVLDDGKLALSRGVYESKSKADDGTETVSYGSFNSVWRLNDDGVWRVVFDAGDRWPEGPTERELEVLNAEDDCEL